MDENEIPDTIIGGMSSEEVVNSPFVSILIIEHLKHTFKIKPEMIEHLEHILSDIKGTIRGGSTSGNPFRRYIDYRDAQAKSKSENIIADREKAVAHAQSVANGISLARKPSSPSKSTTSHESSHPSDTPFIQRCDELIKKLKNHCNGEDVMKLIQKMLEVINERLNGDNDHNDNNNE